MWQQQRNVVNKQKGKGNAETKGEMLRSRTRGGGKHIKTDKT